MELDTSGWSGDGEFTHAIVERLRADPRVAFVRIEDSPAAREDTGYTFISNEVFIRPTVELHRERGRRWLPWPSTAQIPTYALKLTELEALLTADEAVGPPDVVDHGMLQYLRTQRIIPPYQTRGYKLVELVRLYLIESESSR